VLRRVNFTSNLRKAHVTRDSNVIPRLHDEAGSTSWLVQLTWSCSGSTRWLVQSQLVERQTGHYTAIWAIV